MSADRNRYVKIAQVQEILRGAEVAPNSAQARELAALLEAPSAVLDIWTAILCETGNRPTAKAARDAVRRRRQTLAAPDMAGVNWRAVLGYEGLYDVSDTGLIRNAKRGVLVVGEISNHGYPIVRLSKNGRVTRYSIHRLVLTSFVGPRPAGMECLHGDDVKTNNSLSNLRWGTRKENLEDSIRNGRHASTWQTHCKQGHEFTPENTYRKLRPEGGTQRACRACRRTRRADRRPEDASSHGLTGYEYWRCRCEVCVAAHRAAVRNARKRRSEHLEDAPHGTTNGYTGWGCRCEPCATAASTYFRDLRARKAAKSGEFPSAADLHSIREYQQSNPSNVRGI